MKKIYKKLTKDQKERGVVFSSTLSECTTEQSEDAVHEVFEDTHDKDRIMKNLLDDSFFNGSILGMPCPWKYNIIRR